VIKKLLAILGIALLGGSVIAWYVSSSDRPTHSFRTVAVKRGDILAAISATGTIEPEDLVDVGAQVAGQIISFGKDKNGRIIDYGSVVEEGTILAQIDDSLYAADVALASAQLQQAEASVKRAEADLVQLKARFSQAERDWKRAQKLASFEKALSEADYDAYQSAYDTTQANLAVGEAAITEARASAAQAQAALQRAERNLSYCTIRSPVRGVIIDRRVNIGQTVVSSLNAPSLFLIAKDLRRMQVWVSVNEADIGSIFTGQPVSFTVDTYPGREFHGQVSKIRLNATMTQNVVTYTVEVSTDNSDGTLLPYLTANADFEIGRSSNVLLAPLASLRWMPQPDRIAPQFREDPEDRIGSSTLERQQPSALNGNKSAGEGIVWAVEGKYVRPVKVRTGLSDGMLAEIQGDDLREGMELVVGEQSQEEVASGANPFTPQVMKRSRPQERQ